MKTIASRHNPWFKRVRAAIHDHEDELVLEGPKSVEDAIASGWQPIAVFTRGQERGDAIAFTPELFDALAETKTPQGVLGLFERPRGAFAEMVKNTDSIVIALDGVQDPGNVGTIVRLAAAFDAAGIALLPGCADPFGPKAIRASIGAILTVSIAEISIDELLACGLPLYVAEMAGDLTDPPPRAAVMVFGSEGRGASEDVVRAATPLAIPMSARVESLNVASAAAILLARSFALRR